MTRGIVVTGALLVAVTAGAAGQMKTPVDWKWRQDTPGTVVQTLDPTGDAMTFVQMPPGWHVTTGPAALLYHPGYSARGNFAVEAEIHLFEGSSAEEYGIFLGGQNLDGASAAGYIAFVARLDGRGAVLRRGGTAGAPLVDWKVNDAILPHPGKDTVKNILRVDANAAELVFTANGKDVARVPRAGLNVDGQFGFRLGKGINIHASRLDFTQKLAPVPVK